MEKRKLLIAITSVIFLSLTYVTAKGSKYLPKYMSTVEAKKKWGEQKFSKELWRKTPSEQRSLLVFDLIERKLYVGKTFKEVTADLGEHDGYYENDMIPAYIVTPTGKKETWQVIFVSDKDWKKVEEVKIHKNCCS